MRGVLASLEINAVADLHPDGLTAAHRARVARGCETAAAAVSAVREVLSRAGDHAAVAARVAGWAPGDLSWLSWAAAASPALSEGAGIEDRFALWQGSASLRAVGRLAELRPEDTQPLEEVQMESLRACSPEGFQEHLASPQAEARQETRLLVTSLLGPPFSPAAQASVVCWSLMAEWVRVMRAEAAAAGPQDLAGPVQSAAALQWLTRAARARADETSVIWAASCTAMALMVPLGLRTRAEHVAISNQLLRSVELGSLVREHLPPAEVARVNEASARGPADAEQPPLAQAAWQLAVWAYHLEAQRSAEDRPTEQTGASEHHTRLPFFLTDVLVASGEIDRKWALLVQGRGRFHSRDPLLVQVGTRWAATDGEAYCEFDLVSDALVAWVRLVLRAGGVLQNGTRVAAPW